MVDIPALRWNGFGECHSSFTHIHPTLIGLQLSSTPTHKPKPLIPINYDRHTKNDHIIVWINNMNRCVDEEWASTSAMLGTSRVILSTSAIVETVSTWLLPLSKARAHWYRTFTFFLLSVPLLLLPAVESIGLTIYGLKQKTPDAPTVQLASTVQCWSLVTSGNGEKRAVDGAATSEEHSESETPWLIVSSNLATSLAQSSSERTNRGEVRLRFSKSRRQREKFHYNWQARSNINKGLIQQHEQTCNTITATLSMAPFLFLHMLSLTVSPSTRANPRYIFCSFKHAPYVIYYEF